MTCLLGIDLGTSSVRAMIIDADNGRQLALEGEGYNVDIPRPGHAEQDPDLWVKTADAVIARAVANAGIPASTIKAVSFSGQMHGLVCIDKEGRPLRPAIIWQDQRSKESIGHIYEAFTREQVGGWVQNAIAAGFLLGSLHWLMRHEPDVYARTATVLLPKDYLKFRLTGRAVADFSDAAGTTAFDNINMRWSTELIGGIGLDPAKFPECLPSIRAIGEITPEAAARTGLAAGTPVVNGGADQCMQAIGNGIVSDGVFASNIGTGGQMSASIDKPLYDSLFRTNTFAHAVPGRWCIMGGVLASGASMKWLAKQVLGMEGFGGVDGLASQAPAGSGGLLFLPYLGGERTPHFDPDARAMFCGLTLAHDRRHMLRAVMEGVAFALRDSLSIILGLGVDCTRLIASGGGASSPVWLQIQADVFNREIHRSATAEQACLGAAITAGVGAGVYADIPSACAKLVRFDSVAYSPRPANVAVYDEVYGLYRQLYADNKSTFAQLSRIDGETATHGS
jgi:xylulokinase